MLHSFNNTGDGVVVSKINVEDDEVRVRYPCGYAYKHLAVKHGNHVKYNVKCQQPLTGDYVKVSRWHALIIREVDVFGYYT